MGIYGDFFKEYGNDTVIVIEGFEMNHVNAKREQRKQIRLVIGKILHTTITLVIFYCFWLLFRYGEIPTVKEIGYRYNYFVLAGYGAILFFFNRTYNSYLLGYTRMRMLVFAQFISQLFSIVIIYFGVSIGWDHFNNPLPFLSMLAVQFFLDVIWTMVTSNYYF